MSDILNKLVELSETDTYPYHMPGHKRHLSSDVFAQISRIDITEIEGFDNLHHATGLLKEAQEQAAEICGSRRCFYLINGSTCGILAAVFATLKPGETILVARNCHKAVYHAIELRRLRPVYLIPETDEKYDICVGIKAKQVELALEEHPECKAILITSPTYEGIVSEVLGIVSAAHKRRIPLIVDEAHGAHFGFSEVTLQTAVRQGADLVIQSLHKTMPSMTQTSLLHLNGKLVSEEEVSRYLGVFQTSSPSYVLMSSIQECLANVNVHREELFNAYAQRIERFYNKMSQLKSLHVARREDMDCGKVVISVKGTNLGGKELQELLLSRYHLQMEMGCETYVLAILTIFDTEEGFTRLEQALFDIDNECNSVKTIKDRTISMQIPEIGCLACEAVDADWEKIPFTLSAGRISAEYLYLYPPGIPFLVPGERVDEDLIVGVQSYKREGYEIQGNCDASLTVIKVVK